MATARIPERIGRYRIDRELGRGGMGVVYAAHDDELDRPVAIKTVSAAAAADEQARRRFRREARAAARIHHPHVCHLYEIAEDDGELFIAMELLEGESLAGRLGRGGPLPVSEAIGIALEVLDALDDLHRQGLVHRDLKPSNLFLTAHGAKLLDFGLARTVHADLLSSGESTESQLTRTGAVVGTPAYMAPEQLQGRPVDARTDLFALGAVLYEMLVGTRAFSGTTPMQVYHKTLYEPPPALGGSPAARAVDRVMRRALAKRPEDRYGSAAEMAEELRGIGDSEASDAVRAHAVTRLVVLPLRILRPDPETDFLAVSVPDAVTSALAGLESLVVRSSRTAARIAADDLDYRAIAETADVDVVLTGSLLRAGSEVRVSAQLVEVPGGTVLWSHTPQVGLRDVFALQDQIVDHIVRSLSLSLTAREQQRLKADVPASPSAYEFFLRGNQLAVPQGVTSAEHLHLARDLYERCVAADPQFAPAWARLGRCHWLIGKGGEDTPGNTRRAEECFARALDLNPDLPLAHDLYALLEIDQGRARDAMVRLVGRARAGSARPELYGALVQACRYCGLLEASVAAHERARRLDRNVLTGVDHTWWQLGRYDEALEYTKSRFFGESSTTHRTMHALLLGDQGSRVEAVRELRDIESGRLTDYFRDVVVAYRAFLEDRGEESRGAIHRLTARSNDPETLCHLARLLSHLGEPTEALALFADALKRGYNPYRFLERKDPLLLPVRGAAGFAAVQRRAEAAYREALAAFAEAGGNEVLGVDSETLAKRGKDE